MDSHANEPLRLAIVGAGTIGTIHALASRRVPGVQVRLVCSRTPTSARTLALRLGARAVTTLDEALAAPDVDAVLVATPTFLHAEQALAALRAGKHVICEKPLARDLASAQAMVSAAREAGRHLLTGHVVRFFPDMARLRQAVLSGRVGQPALVRLSRAASFPRGAGGWHNRPAESGGVVLDMGIHDLDWLLWTFGPAREVYARGLYGQALPLLDYALITVRMASGVIAHLESSWAEAAGFRVHGEVSGDGGLLTFDSADSAAYAEELRVSPDAEPGVIVPTSYTAESPYVLQMAHWARCLRGEEPPVTPPEEALAALRLSLAALESITSGQPVTL